MTELQPAGALDYRSLSVICTDPPEEPQTQQQAILVWAALKEASIICEGDELSIVYTAETREELMAFLSRLSDGLAP